MEGKRETHIPNIIVKVVLISYCISRVDAHRANATHLYTKSLSNSLIRSTSILERIIRLTGSKCGVVWILRLSIRQWNDVDIGYYMTLLLTKNINFWMLVYL